ncbi:MAG: DegT/DnrJ/EryC1/StrS family aminotransferase [Candidatus Omnitrophica bacterium]|nr:DegT/DnrJ/EryC1/StrS family aminotransferase [Candidatus Omnitrophota bacterium]
MKQKVPLFKIDWNEDDVRAAASVIRSGMYWAEGPAIRAFENELARYIGVKYCLAFNSGTSALHAALLAYGIGEGDEVIVPSFTFIATANAPLFVGARPVFADIEEETFGLDPEDVKKRITPRTRAIIPVHYGGCPCGIEELKKISKRRGLFLIEDAAESFGAMAGGKMAGAFGDCAMLSFCQNKIITTGEGGAALTDSPRIYEKLKLIRSHGRSGAGNYFASSESFDYVSLGYNFRMSSIAAAVGMSQLRRAAKIIALRRQKAEYMSGGLGQIEEIAVFEPPKGHFNVYQLYSVIVKRRREQLREYLASKGIATKVYFDPVHRSRFYAGRSKQAARLPVTERISRQVLSLPIHPGLSCEEMDHIVKTIKTFFRRNK